MGRRKGGSPGRHCGAPGQWVVVALVQDADAPPQQADELGTRVVQAHGDDLQGDAHGHAMGIAGGRLSGTARSVNVTLYRKYGRCFCATAK